jgi:hypothetical protein
MISDFVAPVRLASRRMIDSVVVSNRTLVGIGNPPGL